MLMGSLEFFSPVPKLLCSCLYLFYAIIELHAMNGKNIKHINQSINDFLITK